MQHAARFLLVGTMNPEEGELRPQLLDRFGLTVEVAATREPAERAEVVRRRLAFEADPAPSPPASPPPTRRSPRASPTARALLPSVVLRDRALREITTVCAAFDVDGMRADLVTARAALALAAWAGRTEVTTEDVRTAARLALPHRRRRTPFEAPGLDEQRLDDALDSVEDDDPPPARRRRRRPRAPRSPLRRTDAPPTSRRVDAAPEPQQGAGAGPRCAGPTTRRSSRPG